MNKTKIILAAIGGVCGVAALVLAYLIWDGLSQQDETREELETMRDAIVKHVKAAVKPVKSSVDAIEEQRKAYAEWTVEAQALAVRGDKQFEPTSEAAFKQFMVAEAHRLSELPGGVEGKLVKAGFPFGFQQYILDGAMPPAADLKKLQRQWDDVTTVVSTLANSGIYALVSITIKEGASAAPKAEEAQQGRNANRRNRRQPKREVAQQKESDDEPDVTVMAVEFLTRPAGLVATLNSFAVNERFCVVDDFRFVREKDDLLEALGGEKKTEAAQPASRGRGRGRRAAFVQEEEQQDDDDEISKKGQLVTDPLKASLLKVGMTVKIYDFKSLGAPASEKED